MVCKQLGIADKKFYEAIAGFTGASNRLEKIYETEMSVAFKDFAHSPSKLRATVQAVRQQYPDKKLIACMELHTFSSLRDDFLPQYADCMADADTAFVYFNPEVAQRKRQKELNPETVKEAFGKGNITVFIDSKKLQAELRKIDMNNTALLLMTSGNFSGLDLVKFAEELLG
jgi:UDP-N-acetylmuramate: L-alanyl-gamma-D-glutamyl-meso-diaminopimelate ligase